jgi:hypothetical protein
MPAAINNDIIETTPAFLGLQAYSEAQAASFFGRDEETRKLSTMVMVNTLTIVFGRSGTGKTSLLNAGVFPKLRDNHCLPFRIRLEFNKNSPDLVSQIKNVLKTEIDKYGFKVRSYPGAETLWEYFHKEPLWKGITPILVFDQFEEIFTLAKLDSRFGLKELPAFWEELSDIIENTIPEKLKEQFQNKNEESANNYKSPKAKVVFAFREEYLPEFESITSKIPSLKYSRFRLLSMNGHQAYDVITKTWKERIKKPQAEQIVSYLTNETNEENYDLITVEPSLLSQVCAYIDKERLHAGSTGVSAGLLDKYPKETILRSIYNEAINAAEDAMPKTAGPDPKKASSQVKEFLEEKLITSEGFRTRYNLAGSDDYIKPGIGILQSRYFIREDNNTIELTHDVLAPIIKIDREERRTGIMAAAEKKKRRIITWFLLGCLLAAGAVAYWLITHEATKAKAAAEKAVEKLKADSTGLVMKKDSLQHAYLDAKDSLQKNIDNLNNTMTEKRKELANDYIKGDSAKMIRLQNEIDKLIKDSINWALNKAAWDKKISDLDLQLKKSTSISLNELIENPQKSLSKMKLPVQKPLTDFDEYNKLLENNNALKTGRDKLNAENSGLKKELDKLKNDYDELKKEKNKSNNNGDWKLIINNAYRQSGQTNAPGNTSILLIPDIPQNRAIIKKAKGYDLFCNSVEKDKVSGLQTATYGNGYYFTNVAPGNYLIKICSYYGGSYMCKKKAGADSVRLESLRVY